MKFIGTKTHGVIDYLMGILLIASPWLFGFYNGGAETWVPVVLGAGTILYSLFTNYEAGLVKLITMPAHLALDVLAGIVLAVSPWLFDFDSYVSTPHVVLGVVEIIVAVCTRTRPSTESNDRNNFIPRSTTIS